MAMPKVDIGAAPVQRGMGYPAEFNISSAERLRRRIGDAGGLTGFGVNLTYLPPDDWSKPAPLAFPRRRVRLPDPG